MSEAGGTEPTHHTVSSVFVLLCRSSQQILMPQILLCVLPSLWMVSLCPRAIRRTLSCRRASARLRAWLRFAASSQKIVCNQHEILGACATCTEQTSVLIAIVPRFLVPTLKICATDFLPPHRAAATCARHRRSRPQPTSHVFEQTLLLLSHGGIITVCTHDRMAANTGTVVPSSEVPRSSTSATPRQLELEPILL